MFLSKYLFIHRRVYLQKKHKKRAKYFYLTVSLISFQFSALFADFDQIRKMCYNQEPRQAKKFLMSRCNGEKAHCLKVYKGLIGILYGQEFQDYQDYQDFNITLSVLQSPIMLSWLVNEWFESN